MGMITRMVYLALSEWLTSSEDVSGNIKCTASTDPSRNLFTKAGTFCRG